MHSVALKRHCPFDDFHQQSKILVTEKVVYSRSSAQPDLKKNVHEKTLEMLYQGANRQQNTSSDQRTDNTSWSCPHSAEQKHEMSSKKYRQMQINFSGKLVAPLQPNAESMETVTQESATDLQRCGYCDTSLSCSICKQECHRCHQFFCPRCCLNMSNMADAALCLSCVN